MMTNLIAAVTVALVTNVTEQFPQVAETMPSSRGPNGEIYAVYNYRMVNVLNPTSKTVITTCKEVTTLKFDWREPRKIESEKVLWETRQEFALTNSWLPTTPLTKSDPPTWATNWRGLVVYTNTATLVLTNTGNTIIVSNLPPGILR